MRDLEKRLAEARTEDEERKALLEAAFTFLTSNERYSVYNAAIRLLDGPRAGWIGVPLLAMPEGYNWELTKRDHRQRTSAELWRPVKVAGDTSQWHFYEHAQLPSCALMLAVLSALTQGKDAVG